MDNRSDAWDAVATLRAQIGAGLIGHERLVERLLIALLAGGHVLIEGPPGVAKTRAVTLLAAHLPGDHARIQCTPDLLPSDLTGTQVFRPETGSFDFMPGPVFHTLVLVDEINRAPPKVQSALLEAMAERQVTVGGTTRPLPDPFIVVATQNPIEHEGTFPLPEAQLDRFLMHVLITYPPVEDEVEVIKLVRGEEITANAATKDEGAKPSPRAAIPQEAVFAARREIGAIHVAGAMERYMADLVNATRAPAEFGDDLKRWIEIGASPRASLALDKCGRTHAWLAGRDYVDPEDVRAIAPEVFRHRLRLTYEAQGEGVSPDRVIEEMVKQVALP